MVYCTIGCTNVDIAIRMICEYLSIFEQPAAMSKKYVSYTPGLGLGREGFTGVRSQ